MPVVIRIPVVLRRLTGGRGQIEIDSRPATVGDALAALWSLYPPLRDRVINEQGEVRTPIRIFVGNENIRFMQGLATPVSEGGEIHIAPAKD